MPVALDVTQPTQVEAAARACGDVTLLINNAGISRGSGLLGRRTRFEAARAEFETNFFGLWAMSRAFAPVLAKNGGGAIVNVLSVLSWISFPTVATYSASKSAAWSLSNGLRNELRGAGHAGRQRARGLHGHRHGEPCAGRQDLARRRGARRRWRRWKRASRRCWPMRRRGR